MTRLLWWASHEYTVLSYLIVEVLVRNDLNLICLRGGAKMVISEKQTRWCTVYPKKYAHGFVVLCFVVVMQSFIMNSHEVFIHIHQGCFAGIGAIVRLPQCQWSKHDGYGKISQCITTTKHSKAKTVCIFLGIYCTSLNGIFQFCIHNLWAHIGQIFNMQYTLHVDISHVTVSNTMIYRSLLSSVLIGKSTPYGITQHSSEYTRRGTVNYHS